MENQFEYTGKPKKPSQPWASNLSDMNEEDRIKMDKENLKDMIGRETVLAAATAIPLGVPGIILGTTTGYLQSEYNKEKRKKIYNYEQQDLGAAVNTAMNEL